MTPLPPHALVLLAGCRNEWCERVTAALEIGARARAHRFRASLPLRGAREVLYASARAELHRNRLRCQNDAIPMRR
jgi:hypothetical protein